VLKKLFRKEKPKVYLGTVAVAPRRDIKRHIDQWGEFRHEDIDTSMRATLTGIFDLPSAQNVENPKENDLVLDEMVPKFQSREALDVSLGDIDFPLIWRPKVEMASRLYSLKTGKTIHTAGIVAKLPWRDYFSRLFSWRGLFRFGPTFDANDLEQLLYRACMKLLTELRKAA